MNEKTDNKDGWKVISSETLLEEVASGNSEENELWGMMIPRGAVVLLIGEASTGKTHFLYRLLHNLSEGEELLGLKPPRAMKVLQIDIESLDSVKEDLLSIAGSSPNWDFIYLKIVEKLLEIMETIGKKYDLIVVDSLQVAFPVPDEDSNALANQQMIPLIKISRSSGAAIVLANNSGKGKQSRKFKARGASVRVDRADIAMNFDIFEGGKRRLKAVKSRFGNSGDSIEFEISDNLQYLLTKGADKSRTKIQEMAEKILATMKQYGAPGTEVKRGELIEKLRIEPKAGNEPLFDRALNRLVLRKSIHHPSRGVYVLPEDEESSSDSSDNYPNPRKATPSENLFSGEYAKSAVHALAHALGFNDHSLEELEP